MALFNNKPDSKPKPAPRFIPIFQNSKYIHLTVWVDRNTGVNYIRDYNFTGDSACTGGLNPLYNADGSLIVSTKEEIDVILNRDFPNRALD